MIETWRHDRQEHGAGLAQDERRQVHALLQGQSDSSHRLAHDPLRARALVHAQQGVFYSKGNGT